MIDILIIHKVKMSKLNVCNILNNNIGINFTVKYCFLAVFTENHKL